MTAYVRLEAGNDWGHVYYTLPGKAKSPSGTCSRSSGLKLPAGKIVRVRWPDGSETAEVLIYRDFRETVYDMGHSYSFTDGRPGFLTSTRGVETWVSIGDVDVAAEDVLDREAL